jgi:hypothetical protein
MRGVLRGGVGIRHRQGHLTRPPCSCVLACMRPPRRGGVVAKVGRWVMSGQVQAVTSMLDPHTAAWTPEPAPALTSLTMLAL